MLSISMVALYKVTFERQLVLSGRRKACGAQFCMRKDGALGRFQVIIVRGKFLRETRQFCL